MRGGRTVASISLPSLSNDLQGLADGLRLQDGRGDLRGVSIGQQFLNGADAPNASPVQDRDAVADILDVGQKVAAEEDGLPAVAKLPDKVLDLARADRIEAGGGFV